MPNAKKVAVTYVPLINRFAKEFGVNTPLRMSHVLAQIAVESAELTSTVENLNYSAERLVEIFPKYFTKETAKLYAHKPQMIANRVYANRMGNLSEASGDGWKFRGRGFLQFTGTNMYVRYSRFCGVDLLQQPELLEKPFGATRSAFWYICVYADLLGKIDADDINAVRKGVNGGLNGIKQCKTYLARAKKVLMK